MGMAVNAQDDSRSDYVRAVYERVQIEVPLTHRLSLPLDNIGHFTSTSLPTCHFWCKTVSVNSEEEKELQGIENEGLSKVAGSEREEVIGEVRNYIMGTSVFVLLTCYCDVCFR
jgi:hypothetical protein